MVELLLSRFNRQNAVPPMAVPVAAAVAVPPSSRAKAKAKVPAAGPADAPVGPPLVAAVGAPEGAPGKAPPAAPPIAPVDAPAKAPAEAPLRGGGKVAPAPPPALDQREALPVDEVEGPQIAAEGGQRQRIDEGKYVMVAKERPNSGELTYEEAKKLGVAVEVFFKDVRSLIRTADGTFAVQNMELQQYIVDFSSVKVLSSPIKWLEPWAVHITTNPSLFVIWEGVVDLVKRTKIRTALDIADGLAKEILGVMVRCYIEKKRAMRSVFDPKEKSLPFSTHVGNLICDKSDITSATKLDLSYRLTICAIALGVGATLPEHAADAENEITSAVVNQHDAVVPKATHAVSEQDGASRRADGGGRRSTGAGGGGRVKKSLKHPAWTCGKCKGKGHKKATCTSDLSKNLECWQCGGHGHPAYLCPSEVV